MEVPGQGPASASRLRSRVRSPVRVGAAFEYGPLPTSCVIGPASPQTSVLRWEGRRLCLPSGCPGDEMGLI